VWLESKLSEMLKSKSSCKCPDAITLCSPVEKLVVLTQGRNDAPTLLGDTTEGTLMVLKYECPIQNF
jgi:hypothetical protein